MPNDNVADRRPPPPVLYSPAELAEILGVCLRTVRIWYRAGDLPHIRLPGGRLVRVRREDLVAFLKKHYYPAKEEKV